MILVDSSGWIEYFSEGSHAEQFARHLKDLSQVITPTIVLYEVYKKLKKGRSEQESLEAVAQMSKTQIVELTDSIALSAADVSLEHNLPMADAIVYATALEWDCKIVTMDTDFIKIPQSIVIR